MSFEVCLLGGVCQHATYNQNEASDRYNPVDSPIVEAGYYRIQIYAMHETVCSFHQFLKYDVM